MTKLYIQDSKLVIENWTTRDWRSTKRKKYSAKEISLEILKRILLKQKVKEARKKLEEIGTSERMILIQLFESLILAQDERWRRA